MEKLFTNQDSSSNPVTNFEKNLAKFIFPQALIFALCAFLLSFYLAPSGKEISNDLLKIDTFEEQILSLEPGEIYTLKNSSGFVRGGLSSHEKWCDLYRRDYRYNKME